MKTSEKFMGTVTQALGQRFCEVGDIDESRSHLGCAIRRLLGTAEDKPDAPASESIDKKSREIYSLARRACLGAMPCDCEALSSRVGCRQVDGASLGSKGFEKSTNHLGESRRFRADHVAQLIPIAPTPEEHVVVELRRILPVPNPPGGFFIGGLPLELSRATSRDLGCNVAKPPYIDSP